MEIYVDWLNSRGGKTYQFVDHGCGPDGTLLENDQVNTKADFLLIAENQDPRKIEIKFNRKPSGQFHLKTAQMRSYIKNDVYVVVFSGISNKTGIARFCILTPNILQIELDKGKEILFWNKPCINWNSKNIPEWHQVEMTPIP